MKQVLAALAAALDWLLARLQAAWKRWSTGLNDVRGAPFVAGLQLLCLALVTSSQGADLAVTAGSDFWKAACLVLATGFYGFQSWLWTRYIVGWHKGAKPRALTSWLREWTPRILGGAPFAIAAYATQKAQVDYIALPLILLAFGAAMVFGLWARRGVSTHLKLPTGEKVGDRVRRGSMALGGVTLLVVCLWPVGPAQAVGAISVVFIGLAFITGVLAWALNLSRDSRLPVFTALVLWAVTLSFFPVLDNHQVGRRDLHADLALSPAKSTLEKAFDAWCLQAGCAAGGTPVPIVFVAAEGGASRAGYWAADVLGQLQAKDPSPGGFSRHVFSISSVSGGSVGVMAYVSVLHDQKALKDDDFNAAATDVARPDFLSPAVAGLLFPDLVQRFIPAPVFPDRAETLERAFESSWEHHCAAAADGCTPGLWSQPFLSPWKAAPSQPWLPLVMINGTRLEDGRRIITSSVLITPKQFPGAIDFHAVTGRDVRISTAIANGARFPLVSPGGTLTDLKGHPNGHIIDGGYFDGGGVVTMADTARVVLRMAAAKGIRLHPVFVELNNDSDADETAGPLIRHEDYDDNVLNDAQTHYAVSDLLGPLDGLYNAGGGHGMVAGMSLAQVVHEHNPETDTDAPTDKAPAANTPAAKAPLTPRKGPPAGVPAAKAPAGQPFPDLVPPPPPSEDWGVKPRYHMVHLCKGGGMPMDWALSKAAVTHADHALGIKRDKETSVVDKGPMPCAAYDAVRDILIDVNGAAPASLPKIQPVTAADATSLNGWLSLLAVAVAGIFVAIIAMRRVEAPLRPHTTVSLQTAGSAAAVQAIIDRWKANGHIARAKEAFAFDGLLIASYVLLFCSLAQWAAVRVAAHPPPHPPSPLLLPAALWVSFAAGVADAAEDLLQLRMIARGATPVSFALARIATVAKWALLALSVALIVALLLPLWPH